MESAPVKTFRVHEHLRAKLCDLYENDSIFDKFECTISGGGENVATGSYRYFLTFVDVFTFEDEIDWPDASKVLGVMDGAVVMPIDLLMSNGTRK